MDEPSFICCICGGDGDKFEVIEGDDTKFQQWIYCESCDYETFIDIPDNQYDAWHYYTTLTLNERKD